MTKEELWDSYVAKNPSFEGDKLISMTTTGLKKLFNQTFDYGVREGQAIVKKNRDRKFGDKDIQDFFGGIFNDKPNKNNEKYYD